MRQGKRMTKMNTFSILTVDDDPIMTSTLQAYFQRSGFHVDTENEPEKAVERVRNGRYDILLLDFLMIPICGDQVVEQIRRFNKDIYIILLTGHKSMAPPIKTIRELDIQGYFEKSDRFDQLELLVESCVKSIGQMRTIREYQRGLSTILDVLPRIYHLQAAEKLAESIMEGVREITRSEEAFVGINSCNCVEFSAGNGLGTDLPECIMKRSGSYFTDEVVDRYVHMFRDEGRKEPVAEDQLLILPIRSGQMECIGLIGTRCPGEIRFEQRQLLEIFARQSAQAVQNTTLHAMVNKQKEELVKAYDDLRDGYIEVVSTMRLMVDARDIYTRGHSDRVSYYAVRAAQQLGRSSEYCERLKVASLFHDIGKLGVPDSILLKESKLSEEEYEKVKKHAAKGAEILSAIRRFGGIAPIVRGHHERYDGGGYPDRLRQNEIPEEARIIAVADSFDAMTSDRQYRKSLGYEKAVKELIEGKNTQFDPDIVDAFLIILNDYEKIKEELAWTYEEAVL
ncbi:HD domain-containing protein [Lachnospiraceae bacterium ASD3451]|uniref:HD domain-containing phosphohydrolase n=1 Tax=Diplocloster agilis TaxID=2850323 RepID=UPI001DCCE1EF|nr:HD domain-containing phosphohydrolase [Diplocloster agilis]MBU9744410.1 HD domain-containing protein [Diplocloster agilis]